MSRLHGDDIRIIVALIAVTLMVIFGGCGTFGPPTRELDIETPTRTAVNEAAPDTTKRTVAPPIDTTGTPSLPIAVEEYSNPDTSQVGCITSIIETDSTLTIRTLFGSQTFRSPECGSGQVQTIRPRIAITPRIAPPARPQGSPSVTLSDAVNDRGNHAGYGSDRGGFEKGSFESRVKGEPQTRRQTVTVRQKDPLIEDSLRGWAILLASWAVAAGVGALAKS